jgi:hypothetical protein
MRLLTFSAAVVSVLFAAAIGMVFPALAETGRIGWTAAMLAGFGLLCVLAYGLTLIAESGDESC